MQFGYFYIQEVVGLQSCRKIVVSFKWLTNFVPSLGLNIWSFELKLKKEIIEKVEKQFLQNI